MPGGKKRTGIYLGPEILEYIRSNAAGDIADFGAHIGEPGV